EVIRVDGHDPVELSAAFDRAKAATRPTAIVARTVKGWGVDSMRSSNFHGKPMPAADLEKACAELDATGRRLGASANGVGSTNTLECLGEVLAPPPTRAAARSVECKIAIAPFDEACERVGMGSALKKKKLATRAAYGVALVALGDADPRVVALDGDVSNSTYADRFAQKHPQRFFECKIAEQNMVSVAAGLAAAGKIPFASSFAKFIARAVDQIDMAAISRANIKIVGSHAGVSLGADGPSQMAVSDVAYFRSLTRVDTGLGEVACHVFQPCDAVSAYRCTELMANVNGLCYMRTHRPEASFVYPLSERFEVGGCKQLRRGEHLTLVSCGYMLHIVLQAADR
ncbi:MAG: transketolase, partial [Planctomycetota bacterium]